MKANFSKKVSRSRELWSEERRESPRFELSMYIQKPRVRYVSQKSGEVGIGGVSFKSQRTFRPGERLTVYLTLPELGVTVFARSEVLAVSNSGIRCRFIQIDFEDQRLLARWLDHKSSRYHVRVA